MLRHALVQINRLSVIHITHLAIESAFEGGAVGGVCLDECLSLEELVVHASHDAMSL